MKHNKKINIAEILKNCPKGMELNCISYNGVVRFEKICSDPIYPIKISVKYNNETWQNTLTKYGQTYNTPYNKCIIFPKGKNTWKGFTSPYKFKDGDILYTRNVDDSDPYIFILKKTTKNTHVISYIHIKGDSPLCVTKEWITNWDDKDLRLATEEEKQKLFKAIKENGYHWNEKIKILEKLIKPKFRVGDKIKNKISSHCYTITEIKDDYYSVTCNGEYFYTIPFINEKYHELISNKFDINSLKPYTKVLGRNIDTENWHCDLFSHYEAEDWRCEFKCMGSDYTYCIPYEGNEYLRGTADDCKEYYKIWDE